MYNPSFVYYRTVDFGVNVPSDRSLFMKEGGLVGFGKHHLKITRPPQLTNFFYIHPCIVVVVWGDPPPKTSFSQDYNFFIILYYFFTTRYFTPYEDNIYNTYTTESCLLKNTNQKKGN